MGKSSKSITLALIGSAFLLSGCANNEEEEDQNQNQIPNQAAGAGGRTGGVFIRPRIGGGGYGGGGMSSAGASARGGFGGTGSVGAGA